MFDAVECMALWIASQKLEEKPSGSDQNQPDKKADRAAFRRERHFF
jgi:hypothetical protein